MARMAKQAAPGTKSRLPLNRDRIFETAIGLADEGGIESLSMRKLARELGVEAMSLYNHIANKGDLIDAIVDLVVGEIELPPSPPEEWDSAIRQCAISAHEVFLRHPWACSLVTSPTSNRAARTPRIDYMEWLLRRLREAGFSAELTYHAYHALDSHILGFTLWQLGHSTAAKALGADGQRMADFAAAFLPRLRAGGYHYLAEHVQQHLAAPSGDGAREFEFALDLILDSLRRARAEEPAS
jgi:AcrR family transcriptional regulator